MKILSLVWFQVLPARFGGQKGTALFNKYLAAWAPLVCLCAASNATEEPLPYQLRPELPDGKKQVADPRIWKQVRKTVAEERPTHLVLEYPYHAFAAVRAKQRFGLKLVLHAHNIEYLRFRKLGHPAWRLLKVYERWACRRSDLVLFKTEADRQHAVKHFGLNPAKTCLVPYGIEPGAPASAAGIREKWKIGSGTLLLLFAGTLDYRPNAEAVEALYREVAPRLDASGIDYRVLVCGRNRHPDFRHLEALQHPRIIRTGEVTDILPYYAAADVFINPVLSGGGVQTKVIDALAQHKPVVTFQFGLQGIWWESAAHKVLAVTNGNWPALTAAIAEAAARTGPTPSAFLQQYDWRTITGEVFRRLEQIR